MKNICLQMNRKAWLVIAMVITMAFPALAQNITVTGTVYDQDDDTAIGASVTVQGMPGVGVATDIDGNYRISAPANGHLVVSLVGCKTQIVPVDGRTHIDIHLQSDAAVLDELVVVGYGTVKKEDATGSVAVIKPDDIEAGLATSTQDLLVGASPGVVVTLNGGDPTGSAQIRIRGGASLNASNDPLIVVDGVPQSNLGVGNMNALTMINPTDIESMTILKDASATAIYGSRASNGVIIITTKRGQSGKPQVNFSTNFSVNSARKSLRVMDAYQFADVVNQYGSEATIAQLGYNGELYNTNWQKEVLRTSFSQDYNLSVGGQVGKVLPYRVNVGYTNNQGIIKTSYMERATAGLSLNPKFFNGLLQINANVSGTYARQTDDKKGAIGTALAYDPTKPVYTNIRMQGNTGLYLYNGYYNYIPDGKNDTNSAINPMQLINDQDGKNVSWSSTGNFQIDYALHFLPELHFNLNLGYQFAKDEYDGLTAANSLQAWRNTTLLSNGAPGAATLYKWKRIQQNTLLDFYINYKKEIDAIKSNLDVMVGYSWQHFNWFSHGQTYVNSLGFYGANGNPEGFTYDNGVYYMEHGPKTFMYDGKEYNVIGSELGQLPMNHQSFPSQLLSFFGRINYSLLDTYLLTFTLRDDASSRFAKENRWGLFPSVALGWKINNCFGLKDANWLNELKLRLGWGETGQQDLGDYFLYLPNYTLSSNNWFQYPAYTPGATYPNMGWVSPLYPNSYNANIKWETTTTWNAGIDLSVLNNRITFSADWYLRKTRDLIAYVAVKGSNTSDMMTRNVGSLKNYGLEFNVTAKPIVTKDFTWSTGYNIAWNRNKITSLNDGEMIAHRGTVGGGIGGNLQWFMEGYAADTYRVYEQVYDAAGNPIEGQFVDQNADGVINEQDLIAFHSPEPKVTMNWNNTFNFHNWDLGFVLRASLGNWNYNGIRRARTNTSTIDAYGLNNLLRGEYLFHNTPTTQTALSSYWVENASFLRCDNITLGYTWPELCGNKLRLRVYGAVQNPFVITKYKGVDPELPNGLDADVYPRPVTVTAGLVATF